MIHTAKRLSLLLLLGVLSIFSTVRAQNGLQNIIVEKYYVSNAADSASAAGVLPSGSVTYRLYADMLPGYNFQALYGVSAHPLTITSSTTFFNDENYGGTAPNSISATNIRKFTAMIDSWFSVGSGCSGKFAVRKSADTDGSLGNANAILANFDPTITYPITGTNSRDGLLAGTPLAVTFVGINNTGNGDLGVFDGTSQVGGNFTTNNGSIAALGGATGLDTTNIVCIGQFTTDGVLHYELNIQIGTPTGGTQNYVFSNPTGSELTASFLTGTLGAANQAPTVNITSPANGASFLTGATITLSASAADADGTVSSVEFFVDGVSVGVDNTSPYSATYVGVAGSHTVTARATDDLGAQTTSAGVSITVANNPPPTCSITAPATGSSYVVGDAVSITASATDNVSVASVEFFVDGVLLSTDNTSPYAASYTAALGTHSITARATDNLGAQTTSSAVSISVINNVPPTVSITSPSNGANYTFPANVTFTATAADANGTVSSVGFYVNGSLVGSDNTSPFSFTWTSVIGTALVTAVATDDRGATTTSAAVTVNIIDPNALPYKVVTTNAPCANSSVCLPVRAVDTVRNVIGYDVTMLYNTAKLRPTGVITVASDLITPSYVDVASAIDSVSGSITISLFFNSTAPANTSFAGIGNVFCVEFTKTSTFSSIDTGAVSIPFLQESRYTGVSSRLVEAGKYISYKDSLYRGNLRFWLDNSPIKYNVANPNQYLVTNVNGNNSTCTSLSVNSTQPDTSGVFQYNVADGEKITIEKNIINTTSVQPVINGFDAFLVRRMILNDPTFVPTVYQAVAMDVNMDGVISAGDLSQVNQRAVLFIPEFRQAWNYNASGVSNGSPSKDWMFVDSANTLTTNFAYRISTTFPGDDGIGFSKSRVPVVPFCLPVNSSGLTSCPVLTPDVYKGILIGDVNGNYSTTVPNSSFRMNGNDRIVVDASKAVVTGNHVDVPVSFISEGTVNALDFAMNFNTSKLKFESVLSSGNSMQGLANYNSDDQTLRFTSSSLEGMNSFATVAMVRFSMLNGSFSSADLNTVEGYLNGESVRIDQSAVNNAFHVLLFPNPATEVLNIVSAEEANVELVDLSGRVVLSQANIAASAKTEINIAGLSAGIYMVRVYNSNFIATERIVVNR